MSKFNADQTHCGQYKPYGDFYRVWKIETDATKADAVRWCFEHLYARVIPEEAEWRRNIRYGAEKSGDANYYFAGYYNMRECENGFVFSVCEPFAD